MWTFATLFGPLKPIRWITPRGHWICRMQCLVWLISFFPLFTGKVLQKPGHEASWSRGSVHQWSSEHCRSLDARWLHQLQHQEASEQGGTGALWDHGALGGGPGRALAVGAGLRSAIHPGHHVDQGIHKMHPAPGCFEVSDAAHRAQGRGWYREDYHSRHASPQWDRVPQIQFVQPILGRLQRGDAPSHHFGRSKWTASVFQVSRRLPVPAPPMLIWREPVDTDACGAALHGLEQLLPEDLQDWIWGAVVAASPPSRRLFKMTKGAEFLVGYSLIRMRFQFPSDPLAPMVSFLGLWYPKTVDFERQWEDGARLYVAKGGRREDLLVMKEDLRLWTLLTEG